MTVAITAIYAAILGLILMGLSGYVSFLRAKTGISIGDGGNVALHERIRRHANFAEVVPMALLLMALAELNGASSAWMHAAGIILIISRVIHPIGLAAGNPNSIARGAGAFGTFVAMLISIVAILRPVVGL